MWEEQKEAGRNNLFKDLNKKLNIKTINNKKFLILTALFVVGLIMLFPEVSNAEAAQRVTSFFGFDTSSPQAWINSIYRYGITIIALLSVAGVAYGGIRYLTSMGNQEAVTSGKQAIIAALSGLAIMLLSHMILRTIDPRLVELRLTVPTVDLGTCDSDSDCGEDEICVSPGTDASRCASRDEERSSSTCTTDEECEQRSGTGSRCLRSGEPNSVCSDPQLGTNGRGCDESGGCQGSLRCVNASGRSLCSDGAVGSPCGSDSDCQMENVNCVSNFCRESEGASTPNGSACESDADCQSGICSSGRNSTCVDGTTNTCSNNSDCQDTHYCYTHGEGGPSYYRCREKLSNGSACVDHSDCESGFCHGRWDPRYDETCQDEGYSP